MDTGVGKSIPEGNETVNLLFFDKTKLWRWWYMFQNILKIIALRRRQNTKKNCKKYFVTYRFLVIQGVSVLKNNIDV